MYFADQDCSRYEVARGSGSRGINLNAGVVVDVSENTSALHHHHSPYLTLKP